jgi:hypothetical protein
MTVRKSSWHYRLWKLGRESYSEPRDLCRYFWHLTLIKIVGPLTLISLVFVGIGALLYVIWGHPTETALITFAAIVGIGLLAGVVWLVERMIERHRVQRRLQQLAPPKPPKEPNILWEYLKARKRKVCPLITVVDD